MWMWKREYELLQREIEFWRGKYDEEHARANELVATLLQTNGLPAPQPKDAPESGDDHVPPFIRKLQTQIPELLADTIEDQMDPENIPESEVAN